jgi:ornithine cyclodeaminase
MPADLAYLGGAEIRRLMPPSVAREAIAGAYRAIARGELEGPVRSAFGSPDSVSLLMPGLSPASVGLKVLHQRPENPSRGLPTLVGEVLLWDRQTGELRAVIDAAALTQVRTAALAGHATRLLAPPATRRVALLGAGGQAYDQALALIEATAATELCIWNRSSQRAEALAARLASELPQVGISVAAQPAEAVRGAGAATLATTAAEPLLHASDLPAEVHLNAMGAYRPDMAELAPDIIAGATAVYVDDVAGARQEAGDLIQAAAQGRYDMAELQDLRSAAARSGWTVFKSVGAAIFDLAVAEELVLRRAREGGAAG